VSEGTVTSERGALRVRDLVLPWGARTYVMGIVNATPDSFSGDGVGDPHDAARIALAHLAAGADLVDLGAESTRPGHAPIGVAIERARLFPALAAIRDAAPDAIVSIDTFKPDVYRDARAAGGDLLNSIWGAPDDLIAAAAQAASPIVVMHNKRVALYERDVVDEVLAFLDDAATRCVRAGIPAEHVILDPGIGFGKSLADNLALMNALPLFHALGQPLLLGASRKRTIGALSNEAPAHKRIGGSTAFALAGMNAGVQLLRVHDVFETVQARNVWRGLRDAALTDFSGLADA
jgi:dihydropteroate synthase